VCDRGPATVMAWSASRNPRFFGRRRVNSVEVEQMSLRRLRRAIQDNEVSFPAPVPIFPKQSRADIQWKLVELYFVHNWSPAGIGERYQMTSERVRQVISQWVRRAAVLGYLQEIYRESVEATRRVA
jgi:hypothetical protein